MLSNDAKSTILLRSQVRDTVAWMFSEPMLHYYIQLLTKSWWPNGELATEVPVRTEEDKFKTRVEARRQFLNSVPDFLTNLVGAQSAQRGAMKVFDALQNVQLNKQLFYVSAYLPNFASIMVCIFGCSLIFVLFPGYF